ncbi:hypothetical protein SAMN04487968_102155 [Nocardioides terrae]|uniref:Uncharacterized protein n=1 Tax=Nocardioides terrae TaxID=574651 RepID=A0A1I1EPD0_9ACTN|nr:hypothetical protein [Nocardioides terrae]SFB88512.1 hypothetical protein SAMN04487968_102155 [Nocardioides terrae]
MSGLPRFEEVARLHPVDLVAPGLVGLELDGPGEGPLPQPAPYAAVVAEDREGSGIGRATLRLRSGDDRIEAVLDGRSTELRVGCGGVEQRHRSRRHGRLPRTAAPDGFALTLTGTQVTLFARTGSVWTARARTSLTAHDIDPHDPEWLAGLHAEAAGEVGRVRAGAFGQLGLRDLRLVSNADGTAYRPAGLAESHVLLTATSAGAGFFATAHASVWELDTDALTLRHRADLFFRRGEDVYGDQAVHLVRDPDGAEGPDGLGSWLVATSTWGDFVDPAVDHVHVELGRSTADLLDGRHVIDTEPLHLPTTGLHSVGVWDPHIVAAPRQDGADAAREWLVGYVSARRYFDFHPVVATGPALDALTLRAAATERRATEGTTLVPLPMGAGSGHPGEAAWRVLASDGRDNRRAYRSAYPVFDLDLHQVGTLDAPYPTNLPWPTIVPTPKGMLLIGFDGTPTGGRLPGYGTHGAVVIAREIRD